MADEEMDVEQVLETLNAALVLQQRSALQYSLTAGSTVGFEFQFLTNQFWNFAQAELEDARKLVEKISALGGQPTTEVAPLKWSSDSMEAAQFLVDTETQAIDSMKEVIPHTGQEGRSEALEHLLEHIIMRKQNQVDFLLRACRKV